MEYTIEEMQAMLNIVAAVLGNRHFQQVVHYAHPRFTTLTISI